jgi:hypothetical protein
LEHLRYDVLKEDIMSHISITLTSSNQMTHVPLAALGYALRHAHVLAPLQDVSVPIKTIDHSPTDKIIEALVLILAGDGLPTRLTCCCVPTWD